MHRRAEPSVYLVPKPIYTYQQLSMAEEKIATTPETKKKKKTFKGPRACFVVDKRGCLVETGTNLDKMQQIVGGGIDLFPRVMNDSSPAYKRDIVAFANDEGFCLQLFQNDPAYYVLSALGMRAQPLIYGPVIVYRESEEDLADGLDSAELRLLVDLYESLMACDDVESDEFRELQRQFKADMLALPAPKKKRKGKTAKKNAKDETAEKAPVERKKEKKTTTTTTQRTVVAEKEDGPTRKRVKKDGGSE